MDYQTTSPENLLKTLHWRYATKKFDPTRKIPEETWQVLEQSLLLSPSSFGLQPWKFLVVNNPEVRQTLLGASWNQSQVVDASHLVVFAAKQEVQEVDVDRYVNRMAEVQQTSVDALQGFSGMVKGYLENPPFPLDVAEWTKRQTYIALGFFMTAAAMLGVDTCPMEGFEPTKYDEVLGLAEQGYTAAVLCPAGYRAEDDKSASRPKIRFRFEDVVQYVG
jgi:nitroreductase